ncbi:prolipoprotein diacylglyceryl transferase [Halalkalibaculum roseum]|nr:prolipoprotein diacylglyceryl transferase [Halalkalibaculum roseum]
MQPNNYFIWDGDPIAFSLGTIDLPFPLAIWGIVLAVVVFFWGFSKMVPESSKYEETKEPPAWKVLLLGLGALIGGQLIFLILPSPTIDQIGPIEPRWYGFLFMGSFVVGFFLMRQMYIAAGRTMEELDKLLLYVLIATVVGARLGHVIFYDLGYYLRNPSQIIAIWRGGLASHGAAIGIILAMYLYVKKVPKMSFLWLADRVVIVVAFAGAMIRTGNFMNSEIIGKPTELPWAVVFEKVDMIPRHPTMLYEAILCLVIFALLWIIYKRYEQQPPEGSIFGLFLMLLFGGRFFLEFTKVNQAAFAGEWTINMGQWLSIPLVAIGVWLVWKKVNWKKKGN